MEKKKVIVTGGAGFIGSHLAEAFSKHLKVIGFDIDKAKLSRLSEDPSVGDLFFADDPPEIGRLTLL